MGTAHDQLKGEYVQTRIALLQSPQFLQTFPELRFFHRMQPGWDDAAVQQRIQRYDGAVRIRSLFLKPGP